MDWHELNLQTGEWEKNVEFSNTHEESEAWFEMELPSIDSFCMNILVKYN